MEEKITSLYGGTYSVRNSYTFAGRIDAVTYPSGRTVDYVRNSCICKIDEVTTTYNNITRTVMQNLNYRPFAGPDTMNNGAGAVSNLYDQFGRIQTANPAATHQRTYTYDGNSNLEGIAAGPARHSESYTYDPLNRLESAKGGIYGQISYTYDNVGNRLARTANGIGEVYTYRLRTNRIDRITGPNAVTVFSHDGNGNITAMGNRTLVYNQHNRLVRVEQGGATLGEYTYNGMEQRAVKITSGGTTLFHYDLEGNLIAESDENGTFTAEYLYSGKTVLAKVNVATDRILFYHNSHLGTPLAMADDSDTIVWEGLYQPFGNALVNPYSTEENNLRFAGQYYDAETGLHYNYFRYYDPKLGRYLRADPIGLEGGINLYAYVQNNPVNLIDPYGLRWGGGYAMRPEYDPGWNEFGGVGGGGAGAALGVTAAAAYYANKNKPADSNIYKEEKRKFKEANKYRPPNDEDPDKNPPPPIKPTPKQQIKREPWLARIWRILTSQFSDSGPCQ